MLEKVTIPRMWLLPEPDSSNRLQLQVTHRVTQMGADMLEGFTQQRAAAIHGVFDALHTEHIEPMENTLVSTFRATGVKVLNHFNGCLMPGLRFAGAASAAHALLSVGYYRNATADPLDTYYVVVYWDRVSKLWRLPNEQWAVGHIAGDQCPVDPQAPQAITGFLQKVRNLSPAIEDVLAAYLEE